MSDDLKNENTNDDFSGAENFLENTDKKEEELSAEETDEKIREEEVEELLNEEDQNSVVKDEIESEVISKAQQEQYEKLDNVKEKISKILQSPNVEIVDENIGDEYEFDKSSNESKQQQEDYDALKALFDDNGKHKKELTLTVDDFDYSYMGQYVDEFDLLHSKNIKRIKLQHKHSKHFKRLIVAASVLVVAGLAGFLTYFFLRDKPIFLQSVTLNQTSNAYYIDQDFEYNGLYFIATYSNGSKEYIKLNNSHLVSSVGLVDKSNNNIKFIGGSAVDLTFSYQGFNVVYKVTVKQKEAVALHAIYADGLFDLKVIGNGYLTNNYLKVFCEYRDYGYELLDLSAVNVSVDGDPLEYDTEKKGFVLKNDVTISSQITITFEELTPLTVIYEPSSGIVSNV